MTRLTVAICTYRRYRFVDEIISSLLDQSLNPDDLEVLIIDSAPEGAELKCCFESEIAGKFGRAEYIAVEKIGLSVARNVAIKAATSRFLAFIDDDAIPTRNWALEIVNAFLSVRPTPAVVGGSALPRYERELGKVDYGAKEKLLLHSTIDFGDSSRWFDLNEGPIGANIAYDLEFLRVNGLSFNESLGRLGNRLIGGEEGDLLRRIREKRRSAYYVSDAGVYHIVEEYRLAEAYVIERMYWTGRTHALRQQAEHCPGVIDRIKYFRSARQNRIRLFKGFEDTTSKSRIAWQAYSRGMEKQALENIVSDKYPSLIRESWNEALSEGTKVEYRQDKKRLLVTVRLPSVGYSGGRYHAYMIAIALAYAGHEVDVLRTDVPEFEKDLSALPGFSKVRFFTDSEFQNIPNEEYDSILIVPHFNEPSDIYERLIRKAEGHRTKLGYLNFETPNWVNSMIPGHRDPSLWDDVVQLQSAFDYVVSNSGESDHYARSFFDSTKESCVFDYAYPSINTSAYDDVKKSERQTNRFVYICRFSSTDSHKGQEDFLELMGPEASNCVFDIIIGNGAPSEDWVNALESKCREFSISVEFHNKISDVEKFTLLRRANGLIFLSKFEGFGYPPVEALYSGGHVLAYDIPVVREVCGDFADYVKSGDFGSLKRKLEKLKFKEGAGALDRSVFTELVSLQSFGKKLEGIVFDYA